MSVRPCAARDAGGVPSLMRAAILIVALLLAAAPAQAQPAGADLPPLSWTCPMHPDVIEGEPGTCPLCQMDLVETRLDLAWTCPLHDFILDPDAGQCPVCRRPLIQVTVALAFTCRSHPDVRLASPGVCPIGGEPLVATRAARPHGDHNPRHGGVFFMAPDNWHHLEGTYPGPGIFRIHLYDDFTRPLPAARARGRAVTAETFDPATRQTVETSAFPLVPSPDGRHLEAHVGDLPLPARIVAKLRFGDDGAEHRFDFAFPEYSVEPDARMTVAEPLLRPQTVTPEAPRDILAELTARQRWLEDLIAKGAYNEVYIPALEAKDLALALEERAAPALPGDRRAVLEAATRRIVRAAWLLDNYGDLGDRTRVTEAYDAFAAAVGAVARIELP